MCLAVYVASNDELPVIPWDENKPCFFIVAEDTSNVVRKHFSKKNIYYTGSYMGCGCGFMYGDNIDGNEEEILKRKSFEDILTYLKENLDGEELEIYCCWDGDEWEEKEYESELRMSEFVLPKSFCFREREHIIVKK